MAIRLVAVPAFADAEQPRLASSGILPWHDTEPRGKVASLPKGCAVADGRHAIQMRQPIYESGQDFQQ
jgi:hypothetical protein